MNNNLLTILYHDAFIVIRNLLTTQVVRSAANRYTLTANRFNARYLFTEVQPESTSLADVIQQLEVSAEALQVLTLSAWMLQRVACCEEEDVILRAWQCRQAESRHKANYVSECGWVSSAADGHVTENRISNI